MAWCRQATSHYLSKCWPRPMSPYGVIRSQWVKRLRPQQNGWPSADKKCKLNSLDRVKRAFNSCFIERNIVALEVHMSAAGNRVVFLSYSRNFTKRCDISWLIHLHYHPGQRLYQGRVQTRRLHRLLMPQIGYVCVPLVRDWRTVHDAEPSQRANHLPWGVSAAAPERKMEEGLLGSYEGKDALSHCCLMMLYGVLKFGLGPDGTKPLPAPMLTYHQ